ncbi:MAG: ABC transporter permease [Atribacterota bacterium]|nr:ABC transporter permease [Atribacterota bacterium]MDD4765440.1 ABC transporter permease [Atribacterota bacterium]
MLFSLRVAYRFLIEGKNQSLFIVIGIAVGVSVIIFIGAIITSLQSNLIEQTLGNSAHITISESNDIFQDIKQFSRFGLIENQQVKTVDFQDWRSVLNRLEDESYFTAISPVLDGNGFLVKGGEDTSVLLRGVELERANAIYQISERIIRGSDLLEGNQIIIGKELAEDFKLNVGDMVLIALPNNIRERFNVQGIFDFENQSINSSWIFIDLKRAQKLLDKEDYISRIELQISDVFAADSISSELFSQLNGLVVENWKVQNAQLLNALSSQSFSNYIIQIFVLLAVTLGISSVLGISVIQRSRELGILKALGIKNNSARMIFIFQGAILGFLGALSGTALGVLLITAFTNFVSIFSIEIQLSQVIIIVIITTLACIVSAVIPANSSARLNPIEVIRNA